MKTAPATAFVSVVLATNIATASLGVVDWLRGPRSMTTDHDPRRLHA